MSKHPFRIAIESGASHEALDRLFSRDAVLLAPMLVKPVASVRQILTVIGHAAQIAGPIQYTLEVRDPKQTFLFWKGLVQGFPLEAVTVVVDDDHGLIREIRVLMRSWPIVKLFRDAMYEALAATIPKDYWELGPRQRNNGQPRQLTPIALKPVEMAPNVVLHSPILAKAVSGKREVEQSIHLAHEVQSASSYTSIIATPEMIIELFGCDADGHLMEGMWIHKLDKDGLVNDLTVMLRPYPAVTVLRTMAKELAEKRGFLEKDFWDLGR
jgi:hypothetical protein